MVRVPMADRLKSNPFAALADALPGKKKKAPAKKAKAKTSRADAKKRAAAKNAAAKKALEAMSPERRSKEAAAKRRAAAEARAKKQIERKKAEADAPEAPAAPLEGYSYEDKAAFHQAFGGVRSLDAPSGPARGRHKKKTTPKAKPVRAQVEAQAKAADEAARRRLGELVAGGLKFAIEREPGSVRGRRDGAPASTVRLLERGELPPENTVDLHGQTTAEARRTVRNFVRDQHRKGRRTLAIVHGKGLHSATGGVLRDAVVDALTRDGAAPLVECFCTAPTRLGGEGAMLVRLRSR